MNNLESKRLKNLGPDEESVLEPGSPSIRLYAMTIDMLIILVIFLIVSPYLLHMPVLPDYLLQANWDWAHKRITLTEYRQFVTRYLLDEGGLRVIATNSSLQLLCIAGYFVFFWTHYAASPGKMLFGLAIIINNENSKAGKGIPVMQAISRFLGYILSIVLLGTGFLWAFFNDKKRTLSDYLAGTRVAKVRVLSSTTKERWYRFQMLLGLVFLTIGVIIAVRWLQGE